MKKRLEFLQNAVRESLDLKKSFFEEKSADLISFHDLLRNTARRNALVLLFGNGGSAADAQHFAAELMHRVDKKELGIRALALHTDTSLVTALGNDEGFEQVFARQIKVLASPEDVAIGISTSGNSTNIVEALRKAKEMRCLTVGLLGRDGGKAAAHCDLAFIVPHESTPRIQEVHGMILHLVCQLLELD
jgi:D-sedoheptulose 7-phosphate isomerase